MKRAENKYEGISNLLPNILAGYKAAREPEVMNTDLALKTAQTVKALQEAQGGNLTGFAREWNDLEKLGNMHGKDSEIYKNAYKDFNNRAAGQEMRMQRAGQLMEFYSYNQLPSDVKYQVDSQYGGFGIGPSKAQELFNKKISPELIQGFLNQNQGASVEQAINALENRSGGMPSPQVAMPQPSAQPQPQNNAELFSQVLSKPQNNGQVDNTFLPQNQNIQPADVRSLNQQHALTAGDRSTINNLKGSSAEEAYIAPKVTAALKRYPQTFYGKSPVQIWDSLNPSQKDTDNLAHFFAAQAIQSGIAGNRARLENSSTAMQALNDIKHSSMNIIDSYGWQKTPETYEKAQELISEWVQGMTDARIQGMEGKTSISESQLENQMKGAIKASPSNPQNQTSQPKSSIDVASVLKFAKEIK